MCQALEGEGFRVERKVAGLQTSFIGSFGSGSPVVAILGEFDALPGLSQKKGLTQNEPITAGGHGLDAAITYWEQGLLLLPYP